MENLIDKTEFHFIDLKFLTPTYLAAGMLGLDFNGDVSLLYLEKIIKSKQPIIKELSLKYDELRRTYNGNTIYTDGVTVLTRHHFVWGRMIVAFYYYYYKENHALAKKIASLMLEFVWPQKVKDGVTKGMKLIDEYFQRSQLLDKELNDIEQQSSSITSSEQAHILELENQLAQKDEEIKSLKARIKELEANQEPTESQGAGRPRQMLFESSEIEDEQKEKVLALLKEHKLAERYVNCTKDNPLNQYLESIYWRWQEIGIVREDTVLPTAFYHFLHDKCKLKFEITQKSFTNFMGKILCHKERYPEIWMLVREFFPKMEA